MKNLPEKTPHSTGLPADSNGASVNSKLHGAASASASSISDLPSKPSEDFFALTGKRPDLLLTTEGDVEIEFATVKLTKRPELGEYPLVIGAWITDPFTPYMVVLGGLN